MGTGIFSIGISALNNAQLGLSTTGHNIANADVDGYSRQRTIQVTNIPTLTGSGYVGTGAYVSTIERIYNRFLNEQVNNAQTSLSSLDAYIGSISQLNSMLSNRESGLESALEGFFTGINQVASNPSSLTTRQTMLSSAQILASRIQSLNGQIDEQYKNINGQIEAFVTAINSHSEQLAKLNEQIVSAQAALSHPPNDLLDQRDQVITELNKLIGIQTTTNTNGSLNIFFGNGQPLVLGLATMKLAAVPASGDPSRLAVGMVYSNGTQELPESLISGGSLSGVLRYRSESLDAARNSLGQITASLVLTFNAQHALGQDLLGQTVYDPDFAADFFKISDPVVWSNTTNPPGAAVVSASLLPPSYNVDDHTFYTNLTNSDYQLDYDGASWTLTRLSDRKQWNATSVAGLNGQIQDQGFSLDDNGGLALTGASYLIQPTRNIAQSISVNPTIIADVRQLAVAAAVVASVDPGNTGTAVISPGIVQTGYIPPAAGAPISLTYGSSTGITGFPSFPVDVTENGVTTSYAGYPIPYINGATYTFDGMSFTISGTVRDGDKFNIELNDAGVSDNRNGLLLAQMQIGKTMAGHTATFSTVYSQLVSDAGNKGAEANTLYNAQQVMLREAESARNSVSGVNLDEEAVNLLQYQQSYQAAARMLDIASKMFDAILAIHS